jgi:hypothetical protein
MATAENQATPFYNDVCPETSLRLVDEAVVKWLRALKFRNQFPKVTTGWTSREHAQHHEQNPAQDPKQAHSWPMISVFMTGIVPDLSRRVVGEISRLGFAGTSPAHGTICGTSSENLKIWHGNDQNEVFTLPFPLPYDLTYQVDFYTKTQQDMQWLRGAFLSRFSYTDETFLTNEFPGYGTKLIPIQLSRIDDLTDLEPDERRREIRNTATFTAKAWIFRVPLLKKTIRTINVAMIDAGSDPENLYDCSDFLEWYCDIDHYTFDDDGVLQSVTESPTLSPPDRVLAWMSWVDGTLQNSGP